MTECAIEIKLATKDTEKAFRLISTFREITSLEAPQLRLAKSVILDALGDQFVNILYDDLHTNEHILEHKRFLDEKSLDSLDMFNTLISIRSTNKKRIWQDTYNKDALPREICPQTITLTTKLKRKEYDWNFLEFYYFSNESYKLKAAVFCSAFEAAGFYVVKVSSNDDYEVDYEV